MRLYFAKFRDWGKESYKDVVQAPFYTKYKGNLVVVIDQEVILKSHHIGGPGVCNAMVTNWFERIKKGKKTFAGANWEKKIHKLDRRQRGVTEESLDDFVTIADTRDNVPNTVVKDVAKKEPLDQDWDLGITSEQPLDQGFEEGSEGEKLSEHSIEVSWDFLSEKKATDELRDDSYLVESDFEFLDLTEARRIAQNVAEASTLHKVPHLFFRLRFQGPQGGHQLGIHMEALGKTNEWEIIDDESRIHFMDPNAGEFFVRQSDFSQFLVDWWNGICKWRNFGFTRYILQQEPIV
jgi:hypothetical protein